MATVTVLIVNFAPSRLLRVQPEFGIALAQLSIASRKRQTSAGN